jgi:hypothetical protein
MVSPGVSRRQLDESLSGAQWHFDAIVEFDAGLAVENDDHVDCFGGVHASPASRRQRSCEVGGHLPRAHRHWRRRVRFDGEGKDPPATYRRQKRDNVGLHRFGRRPERFV